MPEVPVGQGKLDIKDCDGPGPETTICVSEESMIRIAGHMKRQSYWIQLAQTCPGIKVESNEVPPAPPMRAAEPTHQGT